MVKKSIDFLGRKKIRGIFAEPLCAFGGAGFRAQWARSSMVAFRRGSKCGGGAIVAQGREEADVRPRIGDERCPDIRVPVDGMARQHGAAVRDGSFSASNSSSPRAKVYKDVLSAKEVGEEIILGFIMHGFIDSFFMYTVRAGDPGLVQQYRERRGKVLEFQLFYCLQLVTVTLPH